MRALPSGILATLCVALLLSCSDSTAPLEPFEGFYVLSSMDGQPVPALLSETPDKQVFVDDGTIEVVSRAGVFRTLHFRDVHPGFVLFNDLAYPGTVERKRDTLFITYPDFGIDRTDTAFVSRNAVTVTLGPIAGSGRRMLHFVRADQM